MLTGGELAITNELTINGDVDGDGKADIEISGNNARQVIGVDSPGLVTLSSLTLSDGFSPFYGGALALYSGSAVAVFSSTIRDSNGFFGGAISNRGGR